MARAPRIPDGFLLAALLSTSCADRPAAQPKLELPALETPASSGSASTDGPRSATDPDAPAISVLFGVFVVDDVSDPPRPTGRPVVNAADVVEARSIQNRDGTIVVQLKLDGPGTERLAKATRDNRSQRLAIVVNDVVTSAPEVKEEITSGAISVPMAAKDHEGQRREADNLVKALGKQRLPADR